MHGTRLSISIHQFAEGGFGLVNHEGEVIKAATTLDEILGQVQRSAHATFSPPPENIAERFRPTLPPPLAATDNRSLGGRLARIVGGKG